jgi:hypothetical protein
MFFVGDFGVFSASREGAFPAGVVDAFAAGCDDAFAGVPGWRVVFVALCERC